MQLCLSLCLSVCLSASHTVYAGQCTILSVWYVYTEEADSCSWTARVVPRDKSSAYTYAVCQLEGLMSINGFYCYDVVNVVVWLCCFCLTFVTLIQWVVDASIVCLFAI